MTASPRDPHDNSSRKSTTKDLSDRGLVERNRDNASSHLLLSLSRMLNDSGQELNQRLEEITFERQNAHSAALDAAIREHERVRLAAERAQALYQLRLRTEQKSQEVAELREFDRLRQQEIENEIKEQIEGYNLLQRIEQENEQATRKVYELKQAQSRLREQQQKAQVVADKGEDTEGVKFRNGGKKVETETDTSPPQGRQLSNNALGHSASYHSINATANSKGPKSQDVVNGIAQKQHSNSILQIAAVQRELEHKRYLDLHVELKQLRKNMGLEAKKDSRLKQEMGNMRREIKKSVGQLTIGKGANEVPIRRIKALLSDAMRIPSPTVDARKFVVSPTLIPDNDADCQVSGLVLYLLNILAKSIVAQFIDEASVSPKSADPVGVAAVTIFADRAFQWQQNSFIDILVAKYHFVCPVLWGIFGSDKTELGRKRLGWGRVEPGGPWVSDQRHSERMTGLGAGFAALALRDFSKSKNQNPFPTSNYWRSLAYIINTPPEDTLQTHFLVLKAMIENYVPRFIGFYGHAARMALRKALVEFPHRSPKSVAASAVSVLPEVLRRDLKLTL